MWKCKRKAKYSTQKQRKEFKTSMRLKLFIIGNVSPENFKQFCYLGLALIDKQEYRSYRIGDGELIIPTDSNNPYLKSKIYLKGVRLQTRDPKSGPEFKDYSYNFGALQIGRNRDCVNNVWELYAVQTKLHMQIVDVMNNPGKQEQKDRIPTSTQDQLKRHGENIYDYLKHSKNQTYYAPSYAGLKYVCNYFYTLFKRQHCTVNTPMVYPSHTNEFQLSTILGTYGLDSSFYPFRSSSWQLYPLLVSATQYKSISDKIAAQIKEAQYTPLGNAESNALQQIKSKVHGCFPNLLNAYTFKMKSQACVVCYKVKDKNELLLSKESLLQNPELLMKRLLRLVNG